MTERRVLRIAMTLRAESGTVYEFTAAPPLTDSFAICSLCGALVIYPERHVDYHERRDVR